MGSRRKRAEGRSEVAEVAVVTNGRVAAGRGGVAGRAISEGSSGRMRSVGSMSSRKWLGVQEWFEPLRKRVLA